VKVGLVSLTIVDAVATEELTAIMNKNKEGSGAVRILLFLLSMETAVVLGLLALFAWVDRDARPIRGLLFIIAAAAAIAITATTLGLARCVRSRRRPGA